MDLEQLKIDRESSSRRSRGTRMPTWVKLLVVVLLLGGAAFLFQRQIADFVDGLRLPLVKTERVIESNAGAVAAATGTSANGYIVAKTRAALSADTPGRIVEMSVQEGSVVKKGDIVARLYADEYSAGLKRAEADIAVAKAGRVRASADVVTADKTLDSLRSNVKAAEADVEQYVAGLRLAQISFDRAKSLLEGRVDTVDRVDRAQRDLDEASSRIAWSKARAEAARDAVAQGEAQLAAARAAVAEADARAEVAQAARDLAAATLEKTAVRAPFDGVIVLKDAEVGEVVSPNSQGGSSARGSVVTMVDFATLEVQAEVPESSIASVKLQGAARVYLDAFPEKPYKGRVDRIWPTANRTKATIEVRVVIEDLDERLRPEMGVRVVFVERNAAVSEDPRILVPLDAVVKRDGTTRVFVLEEDRVKLRTVRTGPERAGRIAVLEGLASGERIVLAPPTSLKDGDRVRVPPSGS